MTNAETFVARTRALLAIGFSSYDSYLASPLWRGIRRRAFATHGKRCHRCGEKASGIHHRDYSRVTLTGASVAALVPVCDACHQWASVDSAGNLRQLSETNRMLRPLRADQRKRRHREARRLPSMSGVDAAQRLRDLERLQSARPVRGVARQIEALRAILATEASARESMRAMDAAVAAIAG